MQILLLTENLMTRAELQGSWSNAGAEVTIDEPLAPPQLVVVDLTLPDVDERIRELRRRYPQVTILAFGPHVDGAAFKRAKAAGASAQVARGKVVARVLSMLEQQ